MRSLLLLVLGAGLLPAASLWQGETLADGTLYSDQVARRAGDLITIMVKETTSVTDQNKTETSRTNSATAAVEALQFRTEPSTSVMPELGLKSNKEFEGEGKFEHKGEVRAVITGRVIDVLENGNLVVEGTRGVRVNDDTKTIRITGVVRPADLRSDNTVLSEKLHGFEVSIVGEGPLSRAQQEGWLGRLLDTVWPF